MGVLQTAQQLEKVWLPTTASLPDDDANKEWVNINTGKLVAGDIVGIDPAGDQIEASLVMLANRISDWSYTDEAGVPLPVTLDNVKLLDMEDFTFLAQKLQMDVESLTPDQKKS